MKIVLSTQIYDCERKCRCNEKVLKLLLLKKSNFLQAFIFSLVCSTQINYRPLHTLHSTPLPAHLFHFVHIHTTYLKRSFILTTPRIILFQNLFRAKNKFLFDKKLQKQWRSVKGKPD